ncbi:hypothetical protein QP162_16280 [Sphingomonas aurantiaca]|uniref:STN domain-containing protein n=1 Tax=Sphingomonas aurantiaca TaxID=185949 RepID=UPI002FDFECFA
MLALGRQSGTSIVVGDPGLWGRRVPAVRGRMSAREALDQPGGFGERRCRRGRIGRLAVGATRGAPCTRPGGAAEGRPRRGAGGGGRGHRRHRQQARRGAARLCGAGGVARRRRSRAWRCGGPTRSSRGWRACRRRIWAPDATSCSSAGSPISSFTGPTQTTVGQYFGDLRLSYNAPDPDLRLYDIASVEVLEGPQGTLYGAGSLGGIIRTVLNAPEMGAVSASIAGAVGDVAW